MRLPTVAPAAALIGVAATLAVACAGLSAEPLTNRSVQRTALGIVVRIDYDLNPSRNPGGEADSGPYLKDGTVGILAGPARVRSVFALPSLGAGHPGVPQIIPSGPSDGCGSPGPIAIKPLASSAYPAVAVWTVIVGKGCLPVGHIFSPLSDTSASYKSVQLFSVVDNPGVSHSDGTLKVRRVRRFTIAKPAGVWYASEWTFALIDGTNRSGRAITIAIDVSRAAGLLSPGETLMLFQTRPNQLPFVELPAAP